MALDHGNTENWRASLEEPLDPLAIVILRCHLKPIGK